MMVVAALIRYYAARPHGIPPRLLSPESGGENCPMLSDECRLKPTRARLHGDQSRRDFRR